MNSVRLILCSTVICMLAVLPAGAYGLSHEYVTTTPFFLDGVLYIGSSEYGTNKGHLRAFDIQDSFPSLLWDAADKIPRAGNSLMQPNYIWEGNQSRFVLTNLANQFVPLSASRAGMLWEDLNVNSPLEAEVLLHSVRGRLGGTLEGPAGNREAPFRLWSINRSSPAIVDGSPVNKDALRRDRVLYVGAADGMLHAFYVSRWDDSLNGYPVSNLDSGVELWAYLPGSFLPFLHSQPSITSSDAEVIHLDGSPIVKELFLDLDGDGYRHWQTLLIGSGTAKYSRKSCLFVLDVTDPYDPALLWEQPLPGDGTGRTRGAIVDQCVGMDSQCLYLTTDFDSIETSAGLHVLAISLSSGELLWQFSTTYSARGPVAESTPAIPSLMDQDSDGENDTLVFGDLMGRLWAIGLNDGLAYGAAPVFTVPGSVDEPIGASVAIYDNIAVFGTGGVQGASEQHQYSLYSVEISNEEGRLRWRYPLAVGEKVWQKPLLDKQGGLIFTAARNYNGLLPQEEPPSGRIIAINSAGDIKSEHNTGSAIIGQAISSPGVVITVSLEGKVKKFGTPSSLSGPTGDIGSINILSWRQR